MRRSHSLQLLGAITVFLVITTFLMFGAYAMEATNNNHAQLASIFALAALGGSFGGTTLFWLLFQCDFARRKKIQSMNSRIEKIEEKQSSFDELKNSFKSLEATIENGKKIDPDEPTT